MMITLEWLEENNACEESIIAFDGYEGDTDALEILNKLRGENPEWANWLIVRLLKKRNRIRYACNAAKSALPLYEAEYPDDSRPRDAIRAAYHFARNPTQANIDSASRAADRAARASSEARAYSASSAADSSASASSAASEARAASATDSAVWAASAASEPLIKYIDYGIKLYIAQEKSK